MTDEEIAMFGADPPGTPVVSRAAVLDDGFRPKRRSVRSALDGHRIYTDALDKEKTRMATTALTITPPPAVPATLPTDQLDLVRRTVANGATDDELALFLYDCKRRGIHPLDKLLHFTKRQGRYTPVTSIDFMRTQAAMSGEMAGSDEPLFTPRNAPPRAVPDEATVTVYRLTQGQRFAYTATARWAEYVPDPGPNGKGDVMWRKMPHTMLGKCAEALALRKAFPQQLAGLYSTEELDQAGAIDTVAVQSPGVTVPVSGADCRQPAAANGGELAALHRPSDDGPDLGTDADDPDAERAWPPGFQRIDDVTTSGDFTCVTWGRDAQGGWLIYKTKIAKVAQAARDAFAAHEPVLLHSKKYPYVDKVERLGEA